jgi:serine/threonine-protein kinase RsbW
VSALIPSAQLRWRRVFPGHEAQLRELRGWLADLLPACPARDDVATVATELAANAVTHTGSGRSGFFAVEVTWTAGMVRVTVADGGAPSEPRFDADPGPLSERGRGLVIVRSLAARTGVCGDARSRLVWADVPWHGTEAVEPPRFSPGLEATIRDGAAALAGRHAGVVTWFGNATLQWWALPRHAEAGGLVCAPSPRELARKLDSLQPWPPPAPRRYPQGRGTTARSAGAAPRGSMLRASRHAPVGAVSLQEC